MAILTDQQLDKIASSVVERFVSENVPLTDGVVEAAKEANFNPEQVKRLVETVNNKTFMHKFNSAEGSPDRMVEFETANPNNAIQRILDAARDLMGAVENQPYDDGPDPMGSEACSPCGDLTDALPMSRPDAPPPLPPEAETPMGEPKVSGTVMIMKLRKTAEELKNQEYQQRYEMTETLQKLAHHFRKKDPKTFVEFEKAALYKWGDGITPYLHTVRRSLNLTPVEYNAKAMTKVAHVFDVSHVPMHLINKMRCCSENIDLLRRGQEKTAAYLAEL